MAKRKFNATFTIVFADGTTMSGDELLRNGKEIRTEDNMEIEMEARRIFNPEYATEVRRKQRTVDLEARRQALIEELKKYE